MPTTPLHDVATAALADAATATRTVLARLGDAFPDDTTTGGIRLPRVAQAGEPEGCNAGWTTGFWTGVAHLLSEVLDAADLADARDRQAETFVDRADRTVDLDHHDLGFLYTLGAVQPWRATGDPELRRAALLAADHLMSRFLEPAGIFQAWGNLDDPEQRGRTIIDSLLNMPLLFWATQETGDDRYAAAARRHSLEVAARILREDGTTHHTFHWDPETGEPLRGTTAQGSGDSSCWARGQAWGIYGFALTHRHTGEPALLDAAVRVADAFLRLLPADGVPYWDLDFTAEDGEERDTSAAAIAVCGLLELVELLPEGQRQDRYAAEAARILRVLAEGWTGVHEGVDGLLAHGVYSKPAGWGVDEANLWGDYFYVEALVRVVRPDLPSPW